MVSIQVPSEKIGLTGEIQHALLVASQQGLAIEAIELGVSSTQYLQIRTEQTVITIGSNLWSCAMDQCDFYVCYGGQDLMQADQQYRNLIRINIKDNVSFLDVWMHPISGETRALSSNQSEFELDNNNHISWLVALLSLDFPIEDALTLARAKMNVSRETWPAHYSSFPTPILQHSKLDINVGWTTEEQLGSFGRLTHDSLGLYPVVDNVTWVERLLKLGITTVQLRIKDDQTVDLEQQIAGAIELGRAYQAQVFINDHWQLAIKYNAFGVHLGQEDLEASNLHQLSQANIRLGLSTHGYYELLRIIQLNPSYIALGHIFPTTTKEMPSKPQGLVRLALYQALIETIPYQDENAVSEGGRDGYPTVAIGGIDLENANDVWQCGVASLAVVRAITLSENPELVVDQFNRLMTQCASKYKESTDAI